jgi:hypothetical protein
MTDPNRYRSPDRVSRWASSDGKSGVGRRGFASLDALFSILPIVFMVLIAMNMVVFISNRAAERSHQEQLFDKLVSIADYTVKSGAIMRNGSVRYPNWLDAGRITRGYIEGLRENASISGLSIFIAESEIATNENGYDICIYRLVVLGNAKDIRRLFVCGR